MGVVLPVRARPSPPAARRLGAAVLGVAVTVAVLGARGAAPSERQPANARTPVRRARRAGGRAPAQPDLRAEAATGNGARVAAGDDRSAGLRRPAALLAASVLADSALGHCRGAFENPAMVAPLGISAVQLLTDATSAVPSAARHAVHLAALAVGAAGTGFHAFNIVRREGGLSWLNLFYAAPLGAPAALSLAGLLGLAAERLASAPGAAPEMFGLPAGHVLAGLVAAGLVGTAGEVWLLHFRGAFHHPAMWLPVVLAPCAALALAAVAAAPGRIARAPARALLRATATLGVIGVGFHVRGVGRQMGGWRNWSQNLLDGPPVAAPPSFTALALAGLWALEHHALWLGASPAAEALRPRGAA